MSKTKDNTMDIKKLLTRANRKDLGLRAAKVKPEWTNKLSSADLRRLATFQAARQGLITVNVITSSIHGVDDFGVMDLDRSDPLADIELMIAGLEASTKMGAR